MIKGIYINYIMTLNFYFMEQTLVIIKIKLGILKQINLFTIIHNQKAMEIGQILLVFYSI